MFRSVRTVRRLLAHRGGPAGAPVRTVRTADAEPDLSAGLHACPACGEQVHVYAVRCRHCGRETEQRAG